MQPQLPNSVQFVKEWDSIYLDGISVATTRREKLLQLSERLASLGIMGNQYSTSLYMRVPESPLRATIALRGLRGAFNWSPFMPDRFCFSLFQPVHLLAIPRSLTCTLHLCRKLHFLYIYAGKNLRYIYSNTARVILTCAFM